MTKFFWRDGRSMIDYNSFGDVICFDTTYRTNKYNMICAPFVGVNHHWKNVIFWLCIFIGWNNCFFYLVVWNILRINGKSKTKDNFYWPMSSNKECHKSYVSWYMSLLVLMTYLKKYYIKFTRALWDSCIQE